MLFKNSKSFKSHVVRWLAMLIIVALPAALTGCKESSDEPVQRHAKTTLLVYMAACNSLGAQGYDEADPAEMRAAIAKNVLGNDKRLLVFHAASDAPARLIELTAKGDVVLKTYSDDDGLLSVSGQRLSGVIDDVRALAPADKLGLVLWSHGNGWLQNGMSEQRATATMAGAGMSPASGLFGNARLQRGENGSEMPDIVSVSPVFSWGEDHGRTMNITTLASALSGKDLSYIYFDCCYMASAEVAYQLRDVTPLIVASATELPVDGMPYDVNLSFLLADTPDLVSAAKNTFDFYNAQSGANRTCTMSVIKTEGLERLALVSAEIVKASGRVTPDGFAPQRFMTESRCWFFDMAQYYEALAKHAGRDDLWQSWRAALNDCVLYAQATPRIWDRLDITYHCGLSSYILGPDADPSLRNYNTLSWYEDVVKLP